MKKVLLITAVVVWLLFGLYLVLPGPDIPPLPGSVKSNEPGDTVQVSNIAAYFNDYSREEVLFFYNNHFNKSAYNNLLLPTYSLNHPPEFAQIRVRDQIQAWYFEELVHPFRESLYIVGWTPALKQASLKIKYAPIIENNRIFYQKTTVRTIYSTLAHRLLVYALMTGMFAWGYFLTKQVFAKRLWNQT